MAKIGLQPTQEHERAVAALMRVSYRTSFFCTNEIGLGNYLSYLCTKFGEHQWNIAVASAEKRNFRYCGSVSPHMRTDYCRSGCKTYSL